MNAPALLNRLRPHRGKLIALLCFGIYALYLYQSKHFSWTEDVRLADGSEVLVERSIAYGKVTHELGGPTSSWISEAKVTIVENGRRLPSWSHPMMPFILGRNPTNGHWMLTANAEDYCEYAQRFDRPAPRFPTFELQGAEWVYTGVPASIAGANANLLLGPPDRDHSSHLTSDQVTDANLRRFPSPEWHSVYPGKPATCTWLMGAAKQTSSSS